MSVDPIADHDQAPTGAGHVSVSRPWRRRDGALEPEAGSGGAERRTAAEAHGTGCEVP